MANFEPNGTNSKKNTAKTTGKKKEGKKAVKKKSGGKDPNKKFIKQQKEANRFGGGNARFAKQQQRIDNAAAKGGKEGRKAAVEKLASGAKA